MSEREQLEQAITALEAQRARQGDAATDAALAHLRQRFAALKPQPITEQRKQVTILFADTAGFTAMSEKMDPEDVRDIMNAYFSQLTTAISHYGGVVEKFIGDAVMAVFGIPIAQESDPENAVRAALAMQQALSILNEELERDRGVHLGMRIGINTGPVVASFLGEDEVENFAVVGDTVNLASRLEQAAPVNGILISHDTYRHVQRGFAVQPLAPLKVKGKSEPIQVYVVHGAKPRTFRLANRGLEGVETRMVGRNTELQLLQHALYSVIAEREARMVTIIGPAGVGKSRLIDEFINQADLLPASVLSVTFFKGRADQQTANVPYALIRDIFANRFEVQDSDSSSVAREKLQHGIVHFMGTANINELPCLGHLIGFDFSNDASLRTILNDARQIRDRAFHYTAQFLRTVAAQRPAIVLLEDIQWADEGSLNMIEYLSRECRHVPLLIICVARRAFFEQRPLWGQGQIRHMRLDLHPLSNEESHELVAQILRKAADVPPALYNLVISRAEGNPFYLEELLKMLIEDGVIVTQADQWQIEASRLAEIRVPPTLTGVLQARLDRLSPPERAILQRAAIVGQAFWEDIVDRLSSETRASSGKRERKKVEINNRYDTRIILGSSQTMDRLNALQKKGLIFWRETSAFAGTQEYMFSHTLLYQVTYESVLKRTRRAYHAQVAAWLIERSGERVGEFAGLIGEHYERAQEPMQAVEWYRQAGKQAQSTYAAETAMTYYRKVLDLLPQTADVAQTMRRAEAYEKLGEMLLGQKRYAEAEKEYTAMRLAAETARDMVAQARAWYGLAEVQESQGNYHTALESISKVEQIAQAIGGRIELVVALQMKGWCLFKLGDIPEALALCNEAWLLSTEIDSLREMARNMNLFGTIHAVLGHHQKAANFMQDALVLHRELGDRIREGGTLYNLGVNAEAFGDYRAAKTYYQDALVIAREIKSREQEMPALGNLGGVRIRLGEYQAGEADLRQAIEMAESADITFPAAYCFLSEACLWQGNIEEAYTLAWRAFEMAYKGTEQKYIGAAWRTLGLITSQHADLLKNSDIAIPVAFSHLKAKVYHPEACFTESLQIFTQIGMEAERARTLRMWAQSELTRGNSTRGKALWQTAREIFMQLEMYLEVERMSSTSS